MAGVRWAAIAVLAVAAAGRAAARGPLPVPVLEGKVLDQQRWSPQGAAARHVLVLLEVHDGTRLVDLGPPRALASSGIRVRTGARLRVRGRYLRLEGRTVLFATEVHQGGRSLALARPELERRLRRDRGAARATGNGPLP